MLADEMLGSSNPGLKNTWYSQDYKIIQNTHKNQSCITVVEKADYSMTSMKPCNRNAQGRQNINITIWQDIKVNISWNCNHQIKYATTYTWTLATFEGFEGKLLLTNVISALQQTASSACHVIIYTYSSTNNCPIDTVNLTCSTNNKLY